MTDQVRSVVVRLSANTSSYIAEMKAAASETEAASARMSRSIGTSSSTQEKALKGVATTAKLATGVVAVGFYEAIKSSANFGQQMALVQTLSHSNRREMQLLAQAALNVGQKYGYTAIQVADAQAELIKAGISTKDILGGSLTGALTLAAAGQTDVATATEVAAAAMTQFKLKGKDVPHIADLLSAGADKALGSVTDLGYALSHAGLTAHQFKIPIEDTVGTLTAFAQAGLIGERAGTTFQQVLLRLASAQGAHAKLLDHYGISLYKANGQIKTMPELADNLQRSLLKLAPAERNHALAVIFGQRAIQGANVLLAEGGKGIQSWINKVNDQGFAAQQASGKLDSLKGDLQKLEAAGQTAFIELGGSSQGPLRQLVQNTTTEIQKITKNGDLQRWSHDISRDFSAVGSAALPLAREVGGVLKGLGSDAKGVADAFNSLPSGVQKLLITGGVLAYGANKLGVLKPVLKGLTGGGLAGTIASKATPVPVFVTNPGFGLPTGGGNGFLKTVEKDIQDLAKNPAVDAGAGWLASRVPWLAKALPGVADLSGSALASLGSTFAALWSAGGDHNQGGKNKDGTFTDAGGVKFRSKAEFLDWEAAANVGNFSKYTMFQGVMVPRAWLKQWLAQQSYDQEKALRGLLHVTGVPPLKDPSKAPSPPVKGVPASIAAPATRMPFGATGDTLGTMLPALFSKATSDGLQLTAKQAAEAKRQIDAFIFSETHTPKEIRSAIKLAGALDALSYLKTLRDQIYGIPSTKTVSLHLKVFGSKDLLGTVTNLIGPGHAEGGTIPGVRWPYGDKMLTPTAPGEEVISNRHGQADRWRPFLKRINAGLADGGTVAPMSLPRFLRSEFDLKFPETLKQWEHALNLSTAAITKETTQRDNLISSRDQLASTISGGVGANLFGNKPSNWDYFTAAQKQAYLTQNPLTQLNTSTANANAYTTAEQQLAKKGLKGSAYGALVGSGDLATVQAFATESKAQLALFQKAFDQNAAAVARAGTVGAGTTFNPQIRESNHHLSELVAEVKTLKAELKKVAHEHAKAINSGRTTGSHHTATHVSTSRG